MADIKADNESLVFALRTLGFYMERDRLVLEAMSLKDQNVRLKKAFDRAVENVCIMSLLYDVKESRAGKLKLSNRRKWSRWQENRNALFIQTISVIHIIDRPCSMSCFLQRQTGHIGKGGLGEDNSVIFDAMVNIIKTSTRDKAEVYYFWAMRRGDCLEIDLQDLPHQSLGW
ncbi:predicted protein [Postia placenta Mad-698-R]|uniref:Uncharacterized protein n=1 Tax=Postia placenta MAD-698-R-SB12 TaxID=670580 RepID=A0A1X6NAJ8_9APHY|nr:hypothetical protein POSPLADRAFT_1133666 [Postia placenta MAD-698-R-SB12]EED81311.1 predicted protein [Postia placenta Mad-698-R]OSX65631.1 hypothetical protein POSPLADRAFT_1133666 [Postia placenta MAD-698-R-SB12]